MPSTPTGPPATSGTPSTSPAARPRRRHWRRWLIGAALLVVSYALLGFLLAPRLLRDALQARGSAALHRAVSVAAVKVNPFTLTVTVMGVEVMDRDATRLAGWESLYVRLAPWKVLRGDLGVAEIRLIRPFGRLALGVAGRLNVQDLLEGDGAPAESARAEAPRSTLGVALDRLEIEQARLVFDDATRSPSFETTVGPLTIRLSDFRTRGGADSPYAFTGTTEAGETFSWSGTVLSQPLRSSGTISFVGVTLPKYDPYSKEEAPALIVESGTVSLDSRYQFEWGATARRLLLSGLKVAVEDLALARRRDRSLALRVPRIELAGGEVDLLGQVAAVAEVKVVGALLRPRRDADGKMALLEMLERPPARVPPTPPPTGPQTPTRTKQAAAPAWKWSVQTVAVEGMVVEAEDQVPPRPVRLSLPEVNVRLTGLAGRPDVACPLTVSVRWGEKGTASATGTVWPLAARADLTIKAEALDLAPLGPYLDDVAPLRLAAAQLGLAARATFDAGGATPAWTFAGEVRLDGLSLRHPVRGEELVRWRSLVLDGVDAASTGARATVKTVRLAEPSLRAIVFEDGTTSMARPAPPTTSTPTPTAAKDTPASGPTWRTAIGLFHLARGRASFVDRSVTPPALLSLTDIEARIANLSSDPRVRSTVEVRAKVDGAAPLTVTGTLNPLQALAYTDLAIAAKGVDLTPLEPYVRKHLGYELRKGKLDLDLAYKVQERTILAGNVIRVDQFTLGEATPSPDATSIPVRLALALLKDRDGVILLDVPVEGRTDDPEFRLGRVIWRAVLNILVKVATSPFNALAALVGGSKEDLSLVEFTPGGAELDDAAHRRIDLLAKALAQRPGLGLELEGTADPAADVAALRRTGLDRRLREAKAAAQRPPASPDAVVLSPDERPRLVEALFRTAHPASKAAPGQPAAGHPAEPPPSAAAMEEQLLAAQPVDPEALVALAAARTAAARAALLSAGVEQARIFTVEGSQRAAAEKGARAYFTVK
ncbi:MAG TPA: DUF748 domain-containing protein [Anaeromyxobacteraceae bacterium]|nr:DUF748 domain-containing protein [Anaeromyxobacteraceae bacterium]